MIRVLYLLGLCAVALARKDDPTSIQHGLIAVPGQFPYQVSVQFLEERVYKPRCGGALISLRHVLTSASCISMVYENYMNLYDAVAVLVGTNDLNNGGKLYKVSKLSAHPNYAWYDPDYTSVNYDIGVIKLREDVDIVSSNYVKPVALALADFDKDADMLFSGWGQTKTNGRPQSDKLRYAEFSYITPQSCQKYFNNYTLDARHICNSPSTNYGACTKDVGGPLVVQDQVVGVCTRIANCAVDRRPDIYISVLYHAHFLLDVMRDDD